MHEEGPIEVLSTDDIGKRVVATDGRSLGVVVDVYEEGDAVARVPEECPVARELVFERFRWVLTPTLLVWFDGDDVAGVDDNAIRLQET